MASRVSIGGGRHVAAELASVFLAMLLLSAGSPSWAQAGDTAGGIAGAIEIVSWNPAYPDNKGRQICRIEGESVACTVSSEKSGVLTVTGGIKGRISGNRITGIAEYDVVGSNGTCDTKQFHRHDEEIVLSPGGTLTQTHSEGVSTITAVFGAACPPEARSSVGREYRASAPTHMVGTWRQIAVGPEPTIAVAPGAAPDADGKSLTRIEGNTIYVTDESGTERVLTLVSPTKGSPPTFSTPGVGDLGDALQRFLAPQLWVANPPPLPAGQGGNYVIAAPLSGEGIGDAIAAAGESVVNWVTGNSAHRNLIALGAGISMAFSHSTFAGAVDGSGATVGKQIIGGIMVAGVTGFVKSLANTFLTDKSGLQRTGEALAKGGGEAAGSIFGNALGGVTPAAVNVFRQGISQTALKLVSQGVNVATDAVVQKLQVSEKTAALVMKAPSYASGLLTLPGPSPETGGISLNFDR